jgi:hypothetical protein
MKNALRQLLNDLEKIEVDNGEIQDTAVREELHDVIREGFVEPKADFELPTYYAMFSDEADAQIRTALVAFFNHPEVIAARTELTTREARLNAFQDETVQSDGGMIFGDYFGWF